MPTQTIYIPREELDEMNRILEMSQPLDDAGETEVIATYTADFGDGVEADIKVCNGDGPFVDPVLFRDGQEICVIEVADELDGEYIFEVDILPDEKVKYTVLVKPSPEPESESTT